MVEIGMGGLEVGADEETEEEELMMEELGGFAFDPGIGEEEGNYTGLLLAHISEYVKETTPGVGTRQSLIEFTRRIEGTNDTQTASESWRQRELWCPPAPFPCQGADLALEASIVRANFDSWIRNTASGCPLLAVQPVVDLLPILATPPTSSPEVSLRPEQDERIARERLAVSQLLEKNPPYWGSLSQEKLTALEATFSDAFTLASKEYGIEEAIAIGNNFRIPTNHLTRDLRELVACQGSLRRLASQVMTNRSSQRLSLDRIEAVLARPSLDGRCLRTFLSAESALDLIRLARLAIVGIPIPRYPGFQPNNKPPRHKQTYRQVYEALNATLVQLWEHCLVFFLPTACLHAIGGIHYTQVGWTRKQGKKAGRYLFDARSKTAGTPLNCYDDDHLNDLRTEWGTLTLPTIHSLVQQILQFEDDQKILWGESFDPTSIILLKGDLSKAFTLLSFSPDSVELTASELYQPSWDPLSSEQSQLYATLLDQLGLPTDIRETLPASDSWTMLYHTGSFGLRLLPFVFGVVSRFLLFLISFAIYGKIAAYVDDFMIVSALPHLAHDHAVVCEIVSLLLGPHSIEWTKFYSGRQGEWIGWLIDLDTRRVSLGKRNLLKVLYGFFSFDTAGHIQARHLLRLASWASRYTTVLRMLTPFTTFLYTQTNGMRNLDAFITLNHATRISIWVWRATLLQLVLEGPDFSRPLDSFRTEDPHYLLEFDSSLYGAGLLVFPLESRDNPLSIPSTLCGQAPFPFDCRRDSSYQNTVELIPVAIGCLTLALRGVRHARLSLRGDSITALSWSTSGRFSGDLCTRTAIVLTILSVHFDYTIVDTQHIPGEENVVCDGLSRMYTTPQGLGYPTSSIIDCGPSSPILDLLHLCDPTLPSPFTSEVLFNEFWFQVQEFVGRLETTQ